jgi:multidrug efflux pump
LIATENPRGRLPVVEFAKARRESGADRRQAMTSFAFILGVVPLVISEGAGAEMRRTPGTAVFSGMLGVTLFGIFLTPLFYFVIQWAIDARARAVAARSKYCRAAVTLSQHRE